MRLYYSPGACSLSPHIVLRESGLPFELTRVNLRTHQTEHGEDYYAINPKGYVPALTLDDGSILTEGPAITQFVADQVPGSKLAPPFGTPARYRLIEWLHFIGTELHKPVGSFFHPLAPDVKEATLAKVTGRLDWTARSLEHKPFLMGQDFTLPDAYLFVILRWARRVAPQTLRAPELGPYFERLLERPAVQAALAAEGL